MHDTPALKDADGKELYRDLATESTASEIKQKTFVL